MRPATRALARLALAPLVALPLLCAPAAARAQETDGAPKLRSTLTGVFSAEQATRGQATFRDNCAACHSAVEFRGTIFPRWIGRTVADVLDQVRRAMPFDQPGSLSRQEYADVLAYVFRLNGLPAGDEALPADSAALALIRIEPKPDSAR